jgi:hypothetical protein
VPVTRTVKPAYIWYRASERIVGQPEVGRGCVNEHHPIRLGHESLDVTLAYLKGKEAESEEAQEHANSSSLALYA